MKEKTLEEINVDENLSVINRLSLNRKSTENTSTNNSLKKPEENLVAHRIPIIIHNQGSEEKIQVNKREIPSVMSDIQKYCF